MKRTLADFAVAVNGALRGEDAAFANVTSDSRTCAAGELFVALRGDRFDGHDFVAAAAERKISGAVVERYLDVAIPANSRAGRAERATGRCCSMAA
jgi:UDP-N-acetylmuramoyl-tripeptide--D-alanyl-D-alanine ligase